MNLSEFQLGLMAGGFVAFGLGFLFFVLFVVWVFAEAAQGPALDERTSAPTITPFRVMRPMPLPICEHGMQSVVWDRTHERYRCTDCEGP